MKNLKIRRVIRKGLPETNSSSSHAISISLSKDYYTPETMNLNIDENGVLRIEGSDSFGWEYEKYNDALTKIKYVFGIPEVKNSPKMKKRIKDIIKSFTGAKKVVLGWEEKYLEDLKENGGDEVEIYNYGPGIDHNSSEIFPEILESSETIKDFIFNPNSWLFLGNDNSSEPNDFYYDNDNEEVKAIASIDFGGEVGRLDLELFEFPSPNIYSQILDSSNGILGNIVINPDTGEAYNSNVVDPKKQLKYIKLMDFITEDTGDLCLLFVSGEVQQKIFNAFTTKNNEDDAEKKQNYENWRKKTVMNVLSQYKTPNDYKIFKITITTKEFGKL